MGSNCGREIADLFFWLKRGKIPKRIFRNPYFWHDTFGRRMKRWFGCEHKNQQLLADDGNPEIYCFDCEKVIKTLPKELK